MNIFSLLQRLSSFQIIVLSFAFLIGTGTLLLMTPWATRDGQGAALLTGPEGHPLGYLVMELSRENVQKLFTGKYGSSNQILILSRYWHPVYASQSDLTARLADDLRSQLLLDGCPGARTEEFRYQIAEHRPTGLILVLQQPQVFTQSTMKLPAISSLRLKRTR